MQKSWLNYGTFTGCGILMPKQWSGILHVIKCKVGKRAKSHFTSWWLAHQKDGRKTHKSDKIFRVLDLCDYCLLFSVYQIFCRSFAIITEKFRNKISDAYFLFHIRNIELWRLSPSHLFSLPVDCTIAMLVNVE